MSSDHEDIIMKDAEIPYRREIPAVPTPDWTIDNFRNTTPLAQKDNDITGSNESSLKCLDMKKTQVSELPLKTSKPAVAENGNASSSISRFVDVPSTPTHSLSTPIYNSINPHSAMTAATPAPASGVNQAINSIKLQNCVSTVNVGCELQLLDIYCKTRYSEYNPQRFQGVVMKLMDPRATALIFRSGKIVCTGARNEYDSYIAARKFARIIEKLGFPARFMDFKIQNFCATADLKFPIRLEALQQAHGQFASYEPELFPGLVYRMVRPRVVLLIFVNGKIVFTGGKNRNEITEALEIIYPILRGYRIS